MIVKGGAAFLEDKASGNQNNYWADCSITYLAIGTSDDTNSGLFGPSHFVSEGIPVSGSSWNGPSIIDFALTDEVCRSPCTFHRNGDVGVFSAVFTNDEIFGGIYVSSTELSIR